MADLGIRSVEVNVRNTTAGAFVIQSIELTSPATMRWITGATPVVGAQLKPGESTVSAVATDNPDSAAGGRVIVGGNGTPPIPVFMQIDVKGAAIATVGQNNLVKGVAEPGGGDPGHGIWKITFSAE